MKNNHLQEFEEIIRNKEEIKFYTGNILGNDYIVGDIHGQFHKLELKLKEINFDSKKDRLFSTGDLVDRGEFSHLVVEWLKKDWFIPVMGNHDEFVFWCQFIKEGFNEKRWYEEMSGGSWWKKVPEHERNVIALELAKLPHAIEINKNNKKIGIVHADVPFELSWDEFKKELKNKNNNVMHTCKINRSRVRNESNPIIKNVDLVYFGHTPFTKPLLKGNCFYVDTGSSYENYPQNSIFYRKWGHIKVLKI